MFTIGYAMIGTPLLLVFLGRIGSGMSDSFRYIYRSVLSDSFRYIYRSVQSDSFRYIYRSVQSDSSLRYIYRSVQSDSFQYIYRSVQSDSFRYIYRSVLSGCFRYIYRSVQSDSSFRCIYRTELSLDLPRRQHLLVIIIQHSASAVDLFMTNKKIRHDDNVDDCETVFHFSRCICRWCRNRRYQNEAGMGQRRKRLLDDDVGKEEYMPTDQVRTTCPPTR